MEGKINIQLFDAITGEVEKEYDDTNFIAPGVQELLKSTMSNFLAMNKLGDTNPTITRTPFQRLILTDGTMAEKPLQDLFVQGVTIGECLTSVAATPGALGGVYNAAQSKILPGKLEMVFDFPAAKANGTFSSVYLTADDLKTYDADSYQKVKYVGMFLGEYDGNIYSKVSNAIYRQDKQGNLLKIKSRDFNRFGGAIITDGKMYLSFGDAEYQIIDLEEFDYISSEKISTPGNYSFLVTYKDGFFYMINNNRVLIKSINNDFSDFEVVADVPFGGAYEEFTMCNDIIFGNQNATTKVNGIDLDGNLYRASKANAVFISGEKEENHMFASSASYCKPIPKYDISSRSLLAQPITKTSAQTMKIKYVIESPEFYS